MYLNEQLIISKSQQTNFAAIKSLNLSNCELTNISKLKILPNLEILGLSANKLNSLKGLQSCEFIQQLDLHANDIRDLNELNYLQNSHLKYLDLTDNPCCHVEDYRTNVLKLLPNLRVLDKLDVTDEELEMALNLKNLDFSLEERNSSNQSQQVRQTLTAHTATSCQKPELELNYQKTPTRPLNMADDMTQEPREPCVGMVPPQEFTEQRNQHFSQYQWTRRARKKFGKGVFSTAREQWSNGELQQQKFSRHSPSNKQQWSNLNHHHLVSPQNRRHVDYGQRQQQQQQQHSEVDVSEWLQMQTLPNNTVHRTSKRGSVSERGVYTICDNRQFFRGHATSRPSHHNYLMSGRDVPSIKVDSISNVSSPTSSNLSSSQDRFWVPRSRRVNLLCASLRFILELDVLTLMDVLGAVHERIEELCTN